MVRELLCRRLRSGSGASARSGQAPEQELHASRAMSVGQNVLSPPPPAAAVVAVAVPSGSTAEAMLSTALASPAVALRSDDRGSARAAVFGRLQEDGTVGANRAQMRLALQSVLNAPSAARRESTPQAAAATVTIAADRTARLGLELVKDLLDCFSLHGSFSVVAAETCTAAAVPPAAMAQSRSRAEA